MSDAVIVFRAVTKRFGETTVYENMDLDVNAGETITIIGGSGQGKSVCLKMMIGLLLPDDGAVHVMGQSVPDLDAEGLTRVRRKVAYVFQGGALFDSMSVLDNVAYGLREHTDLDDAAIAARAETWVSMVGLSPDILLQFPANLSGGERKRVALARSIAIEPEVILYDEPTTGLDPKNITRIGDMIMKLQRELKVTSVVVTHDMPMAHKVSDRIALLHDHRFAYVAGADEMWHSDEPVVRDFIHGKIRRHRGVGT